MITKQHQVLRMAGCHVEPNLIGRFSLGAAILGIALSGVIAPAVNAQSLNETAPADFKRSSATVEAIMTQAVKNIGKRYALNDIQLRQTDDLMKREVRRFLIDHEDKIWPAIRSMISYGMGTKPPDDLDEAQRFAKEIRPLIELARESIFEANNEWREILQPDQLRVHDFDMREMRKTFEHIGKSLDEWEAGNPGRQIFPTPRRVTNGPSRPAEPPIAESIKRNPIIKTLDPDILTSIVEQFIKEYNLDDGQMSAALSILAEFRGKAKSYQDSKRIEFRDVDNEIGRASRERDIKARKLAEQKKKELLRPFYEITKEMEGRLRGLLTSAQLARYNEINKTGTDKSGSDKADSGSQAAKASDKADKPAAGTNQDAAGKRGARTGKPQPVKPSPTDKKDKDNS